MCNLKNLDNLKNATNTNCPLFSLDGYKTLAKAIDIYDGDTFDIVVPYYDQLIHFKTRMFGYDSPEMKPSVKDPNRDEIKKKALASKNRLWFLLNGECPINDIHNNIFPVICHKFDKYGRLLVSVFPKDFNLDLIDPKDRDNWFNKTINYQMINEGYGYIYYGGTKQPKINNII
jgi:endonuclease YncB( thermonuclease family)